MPSDQSSIDNYDTYAEQYDKHIMNPAESPFHAYYEKPAIRAALPSLLGAKVLSIGCGSGIDTKWLKDNGAASAAGIDLSSGLIDIAKRNFPDLSFQVMDMEKLVFEDDSYDLLYSSLAIHYLDDWTTALTEAHRVLKPGGTYVFSCNHPIQSALEHVDSGEDKLSILGRSTNAVTNIRTTYGDYLVAASHGTKAIESKAGGVPIVNYHKTFARMFDEIKASHLTIDRIIEPQPLDIMATTDPKHYEQLTRIPSFMIWVLTKKV